METAVTEATTTPRRLPIVQVGTKEYYRDDRLEEYRNVKNPHEKYTFDEMHTLLRFIDVGGQLWNIISTEAEKLGMLIQVGQSMMNEDILHLITQDGELITVIRNYEPDEEIIENIIGEDRNGV